MDGNRGKYFKAYLFGLIAWFVAFALGLKLGAVTDADTGVILQLRLPRMLLASAVGMGLSVAGAALQALFSNPLCEPYTLGISSGSALGAVVGTYFGVEWVLFGMASTSFIGALVFAGVLYLISLRPGVGNLVLLLAGVMLSFLGSSMVALLMAISDSSGIQGAMFWLLGDLSRARLVGASFALGSILILTLSLWTRWRDLDGLLAGEEGAAALGIQVGSARRRLILLTSMMIGLCVSAAGMIGFIGLIIPHFARRLVGSLHRGLIPLCAIWGAAALSFADILARTMARPLELPVGVVTAIIGAPLFLWVMLQRRGDAA